MECIKINFESYQLNFNMTELYLLNEILLDYETFGEEYLKEHHVNLHEAFAGYKSAFEDIPGYDGPKKDMKGTLQFFNGILLSIGQYKDFASAVSEEAMKVM